MSNIVESKTTEETNNGLMFEPSNNEPALIEANLIKKYKPYFNVLLTCLILS